MFGIIVNRKLECSVLMRISKVTTHQQRRFCRIAICCLFAWKICKNSPTIASVIWMKLSPSISNSISLSPSLFSIFPNLCITSNFSAKLAHVDFWLEMLTMALLFISCFLLFVSFVKVARVRSVYLVRHQSCEHARLFL